MIEQSDNKSLEKLTLTDGGQAIFHELISATSSLDGTALYTEASGRMIAAWPAGAERPNGPPGTILMGNYQ